MTPSVGFDHLYAPLTYICYPCCGLDLALGLDKFVTAHFSIYAGNL